jgi:hypothetical protein
MEEQPKIDVPKPKPVIDPAKAALNKSLETAAWGAFLILLGGFMFVPESTIKSGWWGIAMGLVFLGLNAARYLNHLKMSGFTTFLGILSLIGGTLSLLGVANVDAPLFLIVLGGYLVLKSYFDKRGLFGKAEQG